MYNGESRQETTCMRSGYDVTISVFVDVFARENLKSITTFDCM